MEVLAKPFLTCQDISQILNCSASKASRIRQQIRKQLAKENRQLLTNDIPTKLFVQIMCLDTTLMEVKES